jgi:hypothetical protein
MKNITNIELVPFTKDYIPEKDGKYLVRTEAISQLKTIQYLSTKVKKVWHEKEKRYFCSVDVSNQKVTHISKKTLE